MIALLGPDGCGKTTFADTLQEQLDGTPLAAGRVYMGCWGHDLLPIRQFRRLIPPLASYARVLGSRLHLPVELGAEDRTERSGLVRLAWKAARYAVKSAAFFTVIAAEMTYRYVRKVALSRRPILISDRWVYDLEFRQGRTPFVHGKTARRLWYRLFPAPDGVVYLATPYDVVEKRKPQLDRSQYEAMDQVLRQVLTPQTPLFVSTDQPVEDAVRSFLAGNWERIVERCNARA